MTTPLRSKEDSIIVVEPQCCGFEHAPYNAAMLRTVSIAYPAAKIAFYAERDHVECVRGNLDRFGDESRIDYRPIRVPDRKSLFWKRLLSEFPIFSRTLGSASRMNANVLVLCSITPTGLLALKCLIGLRRFKLPVIAVVHGVLHTLASKESRRLWNWPIGLRRALAFWHPRNLRLIALGDSILKNVLGRIPPRQHSQWSSLDHAYLWPPPEPEHSASNHSSQRPVRFGYVGVSNKGFDVFCRLANEIAPSPESAQFLLNGFYNGRAADIPVCPFIPEIPVKPLTRERFEAGMRNLSYVVWTGKPEQYRFIASATFVDALAFRKPGIYLRNDYVENYFKQLGDIGYLCQSYEEIVSTIRQIVSKFPTERYRRQTENIERGRGIFEPTSIAPRLCNLIASCKREEATFNHCSK